MLLLMILPVLNREYRRLREHSRPSGATRGPVSTRGRGEVHRPAVSCHRLRHEKETSRADPVTIHPTSRVVPSG